MKLNNDICSDPKQIADEFNLYFTSIAEEILKAQPNKCSSYDYEHNQAFKNYISSKLPYDVSFNIPRITEEQILPALKSVDTNKATGIDAMSAKYVHIAAPVLARHLCLIFNTSIENGIFPNLWKHAKVCLVLKSSK